MKNSPSSDSMVILDEKVEPAQKPLASRIEEWVFGIVRGKKGKVKKDIPVRVEEKAAVAEPIAIPSPYEPSRATKEHRFDKIFRDQHQYDYAKTFAVLAMLAVLSYGAYTIYTILPTHPALILGIVLVSGAAGSICSMLNR